MTVTILVPIYGVERYISECAESLFAQTYPHLEYVFIDDCTPDNSIGVLEGVMEHYPERKGHVRIIHHHTNQGLGGARATGISEVNTDCFFIVDSDDFLPLNAIEILVKRMQDTAADIVDGAFQEHRNGVNLGTTLPYHGNSELHKRKILCQNIISAHVWGRLYRSSLIGKIDQLFFEGIDYAEDACAVMRLVDVGRREFVDDVVYFYRIDNTSSYTKNISEKSILSYVKAMSKVYFYYQSEGRTCVQLEIGMLNAYRELLRNDMPLSLADDIIGYKAHNTVTSMLLRIFRSSLPYWMKDVSYRIVRRIVA